MSRNVINSSKNETHSSHENSDNIHDTPSSIKYKYFQVLENIAPEDNKILIENKEVKSNNNSSETTIASK